jgi:GT2 family glycosyltransferase
MNNLQNKFAIGIPTLNRFDLLHPALLFYVRDFPFTKIYVIDNGKQGIREKISHPNIIVIESKENMGVASSWNMLCDLIFQNHDYALILNDDIYLGRKDWEIDNLLSNFKHDFYVTMQDWCAFILPKKTFDKVGKFDEKFYPAYYEDNDYYYRMKLKGYTYYKIPFLNPFLYKSSQTIDKAPELRKFIENNKEYYISKWGGEPNKETFKKPFNK